METKLTAVKHNRAAWLEINTTDKFYFMTFLFRLQKVESLQKVKYLIENHVTAAWVKNIIIMIPEIKN